jgi:hypothetical protein
MNKLSFPAPSHIQAQAWPVAMKGRDLIGIAETGSGKTLAFAVPALMHVANQVKTQFIATFSCIPFRYSLLDRFFFSIDAIHVCKYELEHDMISYNLI